MKILLIDDEEAILEVFEQALATANFEVITALTGSDGIEKTKTQHPDLILLDQILPDMNGNEVLQQLKADPDTKTIPVAILSNFNQDTLVANAMKMGAVDYILKYQVSPGDLVQKANQILQEAHIMPPAPQAVSQIQNPNPQTPTAPVAPVAPAAPLPTTNTSDDEKVTN